MLTNPHVSNFPQKIIIIIISKALYILSLSFPLSLANKSTHIPQKLLFSKPINNSSKKSLKTIDCDNITFEDIGKFPRRAGVGT